MKSPEKTITEMNDFPFHVIVYTINSIYVYIYHVTCK